VIQSTIQALGNICGNLGISSLKSAKLTKERQEDEGRRQKVNARFELLSQ